MPELSPWIDRVGLLAVLVVLALAVRAARKKADAADAKVERLGEVLQNRTAELRRWDQDLAEREQALPPAAPNGHRAAPGRIPLVRGQEPPPRPPVP